MPTDKHTISVIPFLLGIALWLSATCLLLEEAYHAQRFDVATLSVPVLTASTVAAACLAHLRFASFRILSGLGFTVLALLGSLIMSSGTLGRLAEAREGKTADIETVNRTYKLKVDELKAAKVEQVKECRTIGKRCTLWNERVDQLTSELAGITPRATDAKADAIARLTTLAGGNGERAREIVQAIDPLGLPTFLELGSIFFFATAFRRRKRVATVSTPITPLESVTEPKPFHLESVQVNKQFTREEALRDLQAMRGAPSQVALAARWQVNESTVHRWVRSFEKSGAIERLRDGKHRPVALLPAPRKAS